MRKTIFVSDTDYARIRHARAHGKFSFTYERNVKTGEITFKFDPKKANKLCRELNAIIDFGCTSAAEVLDLPVSQAYWL